MDGFGSDSQVIVFAATNRKEMLDSALIRTGRFDRAIEVSLPSIEERKEIIMVHLKPIRLSNDKTLDKYASRLASLTPGFSGADLASICNEAAIMAARNNRDGVTAHDFEMAVERVIGGVERKKIVSQEERKTVAVHESGHAVVSWFLEGGMPLLKLTIIPRSKGALGFA
jgi:AFG3 family protein